MDARFFLVLQNGPVVFHFIRSKINISMVCGNNLIQELFQNHQTFGQFQERLGFQQALQSDLN